MNNCNQKCIHPFRAIWLLGPNFDSLNIVLLDSKTTIFFIQHDRNHTQDCPSAVLETFLLQHSHWTAKNRRQGICFSCIKYLHLSCNWLDSQLKEITHYQESTVNFIQESKVQIQRFLTMIIIKLKKTLTRLFSDIFVELRLWKIMNIR